MTFGLVKELILPDRLISKQALYPIWPVWQDYGDGCFGSS